MEVPHGHWQAWLQDNFQLSYQTAAKFMQVAERFSNVATSRLLNSSQMIELLALPEGETENFVAERFANSTTSWILTYSQMTEMLALPETITRLIIYGSCRAVFKFRTGSEFGSYSNDSVTCTSRR
ncbi:MAG: DUF3102 domain-containing protein [Selenomonadaceae bacterium]|nr:DUF3102 domain-containing protein [Selenomonadaceae bacterium]